MKKKLAETIVKHWNEYFAGSTNATKTKAVLYCARKDDYDVEIVPDGDANDGLAFHHIEELNSICKVFRVNCYVSVWKGKAIGNMF